MKPTFFALTLIPLLASAAPAAEPIALFDGKSLEGWTNKKGGDPGDGWVVEDGTLFRKSGGGDLYTAGEFGDFELRFDWMVAEDGNSGVKYRVTRYPNGSVLGPEYQLLDDDGHPNGEDPKTSAGSAYALLAPNDAKHLNPAGEWNHSKIVARGTKIEHWLNGKMILEFDTTGKDFLEAVADSKFRDRKDFAQNPMGRIMLQDHGDQIRFRNITLTPLD